MNDQLSFPAGHEELRDTCVDFRTCQNCVARARDSKMAPEIHDVVVRHL